MVLSVLPRVDRSWLISLVFGLSDRASFLKFQNMGGSDVLMCRGRAGDGTGTCGDDSGTEAIRKRLGA